MNLLDQPIENDIAGIQDTHYQPTWKRLNAKAAENTSTLCIRLTQLTSKQRLLAHRTAQTAFGIFQILTVNSQSFWQMGLWQKVQ